MTVRPRVTLFPLAALVIATLGFVAPPHASAASFTAQVIELTNAQRQAIRGGRCPSLTENSALSTAGQRHASDMAGRNYFSHRSIGGATLWQRIRQAGYRPRRYAENIAAGQSSAEDVVNGWMNSASHRANILNCRLREIGVGFAHNDGTAYGNYWVEVFASRH